MRYNHRWEFPAEPAVISVQDLPDTGCIGCLLLQDILHFAGYPAPVCQSEDPTHFLISENRRCFGCFDLQEPGRFSIADGQHYPFRYLFSPDLLHKVYHLCLCIISQ